MWYRQDTVEKLMENVSRTINDCFERLLLSCVMCGVCECVWAMCWPSLLTQQGLAQQHPIIYCFYIYRINVLIFIFQMFLFLSVHFFSFSCCLVLFQNSIILKEKAGDMQHNDHLSTICTSHVSKVGTYTSDLWNRTYSIQNMQ